MYVQFPGKESASWDLPALGHATITCVDSYHSRLKRKLRVFARQGLGIGERLIFRKKTASQIILSPVDLTNPHNEQQEANKGSMHGEVSARRKRPLLLSWVQL